MSSAFKQVLKKQKQKESMFNNDLSDSDNNEKEISANDKAGKQKHIKGNGKNKEQKKDKNEEIKNELELNAFKDQTSSEKEWKNRQRTLMLGSRGIGNRFRHLMQDVMNLLPHAKKEAKVEKKIVKDAVDGLCFERSCNNCLYFESRKHKDLFLWLMKSPNGPSVKFAVQNIHTTDELKLTGNCLKYSRPFLSFDKQFDEVPHLQLIKEMLVDTFNTPKSHPKSKPFIDHVLSFNFYDGRIWFRNYQILNQQEEKFTEKDDIEKLVLIEIGPRFTLMPIKAFQGTMGGEALWQNENYITPGKIRSKKFNQFVRRREDKEDRKKYKNKMWKEGQNPDGYLEEAFE